MSRSAFAARFAALVGVPAMHYVARWRMHLATAWLEETDAASDGNGAVPISTEVTTRGVVVPVDA